MDRSTALIVNRNAYRLRRAPELVGRLEAMARGRARVWVTSDASELDAAAAALAAEPHDRVVLVGGDGSYMAGVTALHRAFQGAPLPELVMAPGGTVATVARNWGQLADLVDTVHEVLDNPGALTSAEHPTLRVSEAGGETRIGFIFGTGLVAHFFDKYYAAGAGGYAQAAKIVARIFVGSFVGDRYSRSVLDPLPCTLSVEGRALEARAYSLIVASVVRDLGLHMVVTHRAGEDPERPHLVASPLSTRQLGPQAPRVLLGRPLRGSGVFDDLVRELEVAFDGEGPYVLDGDLLSARRVTVSAGPRIRVAHP